jgi:CheY-like chemotaxis protein
MGSGWSGKFPAKVNGIRVLTGFLMQPPAAVCTRTDLPSPPRQPVPPAGRIGAFHFCEHTICYLTVVTMPDTTPSNDLENASDIDIKSILLIDDDVQLADTLKVLLESRNFVVTTARNGVEGLREVMAMDFDVIICDMMMPTMPGDMFYLAVQKVKPALCRRFLFVTGHAREPRINDFLQRADGLVLIKPVPSEELLQMISLVMQRNEHFPPAASGV